MNFNKISKAMGAMVVLGAFSGATVAAENAAGVKDFMGKTLEETKKAVQAAEAGDKAGCLAAIKQTKQYYKEVTGDPAGKPLQDAMKKVRQGQELCDGGIFKDKDAQTPGASTLLKEAAGTMEKIYAAIP